MNEKAVIYRVHQTCCGTDGGYSDFNTWQEAEAFRESYTSGPGVNPNGYCGSTSHLSGHQRSGVITTVNIQAAHAHA